LPDYSKTTTDFLLESESIINRIDEYSVETAIELYDRLEKAAWLSSENIKEIDSEVRVEICKKLDLLLEHIVDIISFRQIGEQTGVYTPAIHAHRRWQNVELMKDKGLAGYMLAKEIGASAVMLFGTKSEEYTYLADLPSMQLLFTELKSGSADAYYDHLRANYNKMDILILHGMYPETQMYLNEYRKLRPDGKVYCGLDMSSYWMVKINWSYPAIRRFATQCDMIATSCRSLRDELNRKYTVNFPCRYFPNGFYNSKNIKIVAESNMKENTIITVGRIGSGEKNHAELMIAFAKAFDTLKDWKLKLIGSIEPKFQAIINEFFSAFPDLKNRIIFTGAITDKVELYNEYAKAKIFALTSPSEGGTPNVYAEALFHGCMFITSDIDGADDITNCGELGIKYKRGNVEELTKSLIKLCSNADTSVFSKHIPKSLAYATRYYDWNRNAKKLAYALLKPKMTT